MTYDDAGNMLSRKKYSYTTGTLGSVLSTQTFTYGKDGWGDVLTKINSTTVTSDASGNMLRDGTNTYTWKNGRQLATVTRNGVTWTNTYDASGMRTQRVSGSTIYAYIYDGGNLSQMTVGSNALIFTYGINGQPMSVNYNGTDYYYITNSQGDVVGILNSSGTEVVTYTYDAWGNILSTGGTMASTLGAHNPLLYRSYVYDRETKLYYLQSRYYNPEIGRFINADDIGYLGADGTLQSYNLFAYCGNNPVMNVDPNGHESMPNWLKWVVGGVVIVGLGVATVATGGAAAGVAGFIVAGAFKGAVIGAVSGALLNGTIQGISSASSGENFWNGFSDGAASGFMSGAIVGGITGAVSSSMQVANAAKMWAHTGNKTGYQQMVEHYANHVIKEGQKHAAKNIVNYTKDACSFFARNKTSGYLLREGVVKIAGAPGGIFNTDGLIRSFWYILR